MSNVLELVRADLRGFAGYKSARSESLQGDVWLNANESAWANPADSSGSSRRYPEPQPSRLRQTLAQLYQCRPEQLLLGRGSDEAIDLLVRVLCEPGRDAVLVTPPVFGMYAVSARLQNAVLVEVPLQDGPEGFVCDLAAVESRARQTRSKLVFLCSPSNPTGGLVPLDAIATLARQLRGQSLVVVDEAYAEFSSQASAVSLMTEHDNIAVLRTLSKAHALAAARVGVVIAEEALIAVLRACQAPYPLPTPCVELALAGLSAEALQQTGERVASIISERERMQLQLQQMSGVRSVYPSQGNYLLVRFDDAQAAFERLLAAGVVVRDQRGAPQLQDALRITIGLAEHNQRVLQALRQQEIAA
ncbi:histidinol-phosphate aminotransferase [Pseudoxanthomonas dokdonensis]|uniref:Histidinol-phosphate aminotransferase n=2 Tax=Pseudoxanthomonas dokdonensis TaxID=344882 RepID=A0A0R0CWQ9_9GAMM|nr:histidinol-phosphate aminotransferase [Pseudoxanthomonas dokdonensis]